jgi:two-component system, cell cycle sensor histidine kinase and response regulator CckA
MRCDTLRVAVRHPARLEAARAIKLGAVDYLLKDRLTRLGQAVRQAQVQRRLRVAERQARDALLASEERYPTLADVVPRMTGRAARAGRSTG